MEIFGEHAGYGRFEKSLYFIKLEAVIIREIFWKSEYEAVGCELVQEYPKYVFQKPKLSCLWSFA